MKNIRDIKKHLRPEDYVFIGKITGYSPDYVKNCIYYRRNNRLIVEAASLLLDADCSVLAYSHIPTGTISNTCPSGSAK